MGKPKRKSKLFQDELLDGEELLWLGQPDPRALFTRYDLFLIPFSLFWCGFVTFWLAGASRGGVFALFGVPHALVGIYLLIGRFVYKYWKKRNTYYGVTNQRILIQSGLVGTKLDTLAIANLPSVNKSYGLTGSGSVTFGLTPRTSWWSRGQMNYANTGLEIFGGDVPGFYDIRETDEVYRLISQLQHEHFQYR